MNFKTTWILFGVLLLLLGGTALLLLTGPKPGEEGKLLAGIDPKDVTRVVVERRQPTETRLVFVRVDKDHWKLEEPYAANLDGRTVESMVGDVVNAKTTTKGADLSGSPGSFDLDRPPLSVMLTAGDTTITVNFGKVSLGSSESSFVYANTSRDRNPVAIKRSSLAAAFRDVPDAKNAGDLFKPVNAFRQPDLLLANHAFDAINVVTTVRLKGDKAEIVLNKTTGGTWQFEKPAGFGDADVEGDPGTAATGAPPNGIKPLLNDLAQVRASSTDDFIEDVTDFKQYGLDPPAGPRLEVVVAGKGENAAPTTEVVTVGKKEDKGDKVYVRPGNEHAVAKVSEKSIEPLRKLIDDPGALRSRALLPAGTVGLDALDIRVGSDPAIELRKLPDGWKLYGAAGAPKPANNQAVQDLISQLGNRRLIREFPDPKLSDADKGFDKPSAVVTLWVNGIVEEPKPEEKKDAKQGGEAQQAPPAKKDTVSDSSQKHSQPPESKDAKKEEKKEPAKPKLKEPTAKLTFGKRDKDLLYVRREINGAKADFAVPESLLPVITRGRLDYLDQILPSFTPDQATKLTFTRGGVTWVVEKETKDKAAPTWVIRQPANLAGRPAEASQVSALLGDLAGLRPSRLWAEKATDRELERFGLKAPAVTAVVALTDEKKKEMTYQFGAETDDKSQVYARQGGADLVFSVPKSTVETIRQADVIDYTVFKLDLSKVTGLRLTGWANLNVERKPQTLDLERKGANNWSVKAPAAFKLSSSQAESFLTALATVRAEKFVVHKTGPKPEYKLQPADGALAVEIAELGVLDGTTLTIGGEAEGGKSYYAQSNKSPGDVFLVPKERFEKFKANPNAFAAE
jgi:hypothetical protein